MTPIVTFHGDLALKERLVAAAIRHRDAPPPGDGDIVWLLDGLDRAGTSEGFDPDRTWQARLDAHQRGVDWVNVLVWTAALMVCLAIWSWIGWLAWSGLEAMLDEAMAAPGMTEGR